MPAQTVFITGATSGIGSATATTFAKAGANLILHGRREKPLKELATQCQDLGAKVTTVCFDLTDTDQITKAISSFRTLDVAINNAGFEGKIDDVTRLTLKDFDQVMDINVRALFWCLKEEISWFRKHSKPGNIINVSSIAGIMGIPTSSLYVGAKHAVEGMTKSLALEQIPHGIRINAVCPGGTNTPMLERVYNGDLKAAAQAHPIGRIAEPQEIADGIFWLASKESSYVVGHSLVIDGGRTL